MEIPRWIPKKVVEESESLGGMDIDNSEDLQEKPYFDKGMHKFLSLFHKPNHKNHFKKEGEIYEQKIQSE